MSDVSRFMLRERTDEWVESTAENLVTSITGDPDEWDGMGQEEQDIVMTAVNDLYNSLAVTVPLTVAAALMLPEVRSGERWVALAEHGHQYRVDGSHLWERGGFDGGWSWWGEATLSIPDLDAPCTLITPTTPAGDASGERGR